ncbi:MAG: hypothetical protein V1804_02925 [Patescibacteria group bacterium]
MKKKIALMVIMAVFFIFSVSAIFAQVQVKGMSWAGSSTGSIRNSIRTEIVVKIEDVSAERNRMTISYSRKSFREDRKDIFEAEIRGTNPLKFSFVNAEGYEMTCELQPDNRLMLTGGLRFTYLDPL